MSMAVSFAKFENKMKFMGGEKNTNNATKDPAPAHHRKQMMDEIYTDVLSRCHNKGVL